MSKSGRRVCLFVAAGLVLAAGTAWFALWYKFDRVELLEDLPFERAELQSLPAANVPPGWPFSLENVAGRYSWGLWGKLEIRADGSWTGDDHEFLGHPQRSTGKARVVEGRLEFEVYSAKGKATGKRCYCIPVFWGGQLYLMDRKWVVAICDHLNWYTNPNEMFGFVRREPGESNPSTAVPSFPRPLLPPIYDAMILREPLNGTISKVLPDGSAVVNFGARKGAFEGMTLRAKTGEQAQYSQHSGARLLILSLSPDSCVVRRDDKGVPLTEGMEVWCPADGPGLK